MQNRTNWLPLVVVALIAAAVGFFVGRITSSGMSAEKTRELESDIERTIDQLDSLLAQGPSQASGWRASKKYWKVMEWHSPELFEAVGNAPGDDELERIRMIGIRIAAQGEPGYEQAGKMIRNLIGEDCIRLEFENPGLVERDEEGALACYVFLFGENVNVELVRRGWARGVLRSDRNRYGRDLHDAELRAREEGAGIWAWSQDSRPSWWDSTGPEWTFEETPERPSRLFPFLEEAEEGEN